MSGPNYAGERGVPGTPGRFTDQELARCARRELSHRRKVYYRLCLEGKMNRDDAAEEIAMMKQIAEFFEEKTNPKLL